MTWNDEDVVELEVSEVLKETDLAVLCVIEEDEVWLPKSQIREGVELLSEGTVDVVITIPQWLAEEKGLV